MSYGAILFQPEIVLRKYVSTAFAILMSSVVKGCETDNLQSSADPVWDSNPEQRAGTVVAF